MSFFHGASKDPSSKGYRRLHQHWSLSKLLKHSPGGGHGNPIGDKVPRGLPAPLSLPLLDASVDRTSEDQAAEPATIELTASFRLRSSINEPHLSFPCHPASPRPSYLTRVSQSRQAHTPCRVGQVETRIGSPKRQSRTSP
jgi:hypothetical protein